MRLVRPVLRRKRRVDVDDPLIARAPARADATELMGFVREGRSAGLRLR
jgi:hypothetical protein